MLKKSAAKFKRRRSVTVVVFPMDVSRFQWPRPRNGFDRPDRPSDDRSTGRKALDTAKGSPNRFSPVPFVVGLLLVPTPFEPVTPVCTPSPKLLGFAVGTLPVLNPSASVPPQTCEPSTATSGWPLIAVKMPELYQPSINRFTTECERLNGRL